MAAIVNSRRLPTGTRIPGVLQQVTIGGCTFRPYAPLELGDVVRIEVADAGAEAVVLARTAGVCTCRFTGVTTVVLDAAIQESFRAAA